MYVVGKAININITALEEVWGHTPGNINKQRMGVRYEAPRGPQEGKLEDSSSLQTKGVEFESKQSRQQDQMPLKSQLRWKLKMATEFSN